MIFIIHSASLGYLSVAYSQNPSWIGFDAHAFIVEATSPDEALTIAERFCAERLVWPNDAHALLLS